MRVRDQYTTPYIAGYIHDRRHVHTFPASHIQSCTAVVATDILVLVFLCRCKHQHLKTPNCRGLGHLKSGHLRPLDYVRNSCIEAPPVCRLTQSSVAGRKDLSYNIQQLMYFPLKVLCVLTQNPVSLCQMLALNTQNIVIHYVCYSQLFSFGFTVSNHIIVSLPPSKVTLGTHSQMVM